MTFGAPLLVNFRLIVWDIDEIAGTKSVRDIKEQEVYGRYSFNDQECNFRCKWNRKSCCQSNASFPGVFLIMILVNSY